MRKLILLLVLLATMASAQSVRLGTQTKGTLPATQGGMGRDATGSSEGQVPMWNVATSSFIPGDPIVSGPDAVAATPTRNPVQIGCLFLTTPATLANNQVGAVQCDSGQRLLVNVTNTSFLAVQSGTWNIGTVTSITNTVTTDVTDRSGRLLGHVTVDTAPSTAVTGTFWPTTAAAPASHRLSDGSAFYDAAKTGQLPSALDGSGFLKVHEQGSVGVTGPLTDTQLRASAFDVNVSDRAARLLGVVYGSQAQQLKQTATNFNLQTELATGGTLYDARQIRALTNADVVKSQLQDNAGSAITLGQKTTANSIPVVFSSDNITTGSTAALNALNAVASVSLSGHSGAGFFLAAGTLVGTLTPEISYDGGTTYVATLFFDAKQNTTYPTVVFGSSNTAQSLTVMAGNGVTNAQVRVSAFTSGTANGTMRATDSDAQLMVNTQIDGKKATYHIAVSALACAASTTFPCITIYGSASKTLRVTHLRVSGSAGTAALQSYFVNKLSSVPTGGTSSTFTAVALDSNDVAATATTLNKYTAAATGGAAIVGTISSYRCLAGSATVADNCLADLQFGNMPGAHAITLRGTTQGVGVYSTIATTVDFEGEWTEE